MYLCLSLFEWFPFIFQFLGKQKYTNKPIFPNNPSLQQSYLQFTIKKCIEYPTKNFGKDA